jgi:hypothetical protein
MGSDREEITTMSFTFQIDGCTITHPAKFSVNAKMLDGSRADFWTDDRAEALERFARLKTDGRTRFLMAFDYEAVRELELDVKLDPAVDYRALSDRLISEAMDRMGQELG